MSLLKKGLMLGGVALLFLSGCTTKKEVAKILEENPEIIFNAIEKNPLKFADAFQKASMEARKQQQARAEDEEKKRIDEEMKNPKSPVIGENRAVRGERNAPIQIVTYSDFQCPYCQRGFQTVETLRKKYGAKITFMFKNLPLSFHPLAMPAAKRFEAIAMQNAEKAYKFHDEVFTNQQKLGAEGEKFLDGVAKKVGANIDKMKKDMESEEVRARIAADSEEAKKFGIEGTPGFVVAGVVLKGAMPVEYFEQILEKRQVSAK